MSEELMVELELLRRLLGTAEDGDDPPSVAVFPAAWPDDLPLAWPDLPGTRVWGSVRSAATRWTFAYGAGVPDTGTPGTGPQPPTARRLTRWRVCLDVASAQPETLATLRAALAAQGWQAGQMWQQAFVEHAQTTWNAVHVGTSRLLTLQTRGDEIGVPTQVWLTVQDLEEGAVGHWLGRPVFPQFSEFYHAPLPTLAALPGWRVIPQGGQGGADHSATALLIPPQDQSSGLAALLAAFGPQLAAQGWTVLPTVQEGAGHNVRLALQTPQGFGALGLDQVGEAVSAKLVHITFGHPETGGQSSYTLTSS